MELIDASLVDWSRAQFALTAMYHWLFVPLTLGLGVIVAVMETIYVVRGSVFWKDVARFWMSLFGVNFAIGVATGIILEFEFGSNWSNYSWFVGDIFGAPLAIEGIVAFFLETTFLAVMFFGWNKVGKIPHLVSTWLTMIGACLSAVWILVANAWMQHPVGMAFNPETVRNEMVDFAAVVFNPVAVSKFFHVVSSSWVLGSVFVVGVSCWYLFRRRHEAFALSSIRVAASLGLAATFLTGITGHASAVNMAKFQPMKLAAAEGLYEGGTGVGLVAVGLLNPAADWSRADENAFLFRFEIPKALSWLATGDADRYVPGINDLLRGGYETEQGDIALSAEEMMARGRRAIAALGDFRRAAAVGRSEEARVAEVVLEKDFPYFGYGYLKKASDLTPPVPLTFYSFRLMVVSGCFFAALFAGVLAAGRRLATWGTWRRPVFLGILCCIPLAYAASEAGWIVAEVGRQPWAVQGLLPNCAAVSRLAVGSVQTTFFLFLAIFSLLLVAEVGIMLKVIAKGPNV